LNRPYTDGAARALVPPDPLFSTAALTFRPGSQESAGAEYFHFFWARNAIFHGLRALGIRPGQKILVPAYLCAAAIEPIEHFGAKVEFYAIRQNCEPDWLDIETKIRGGARGILAVHYFGFPCDIARFCALRDQYDVFVIEDCAHVLDGVPNQHRFGEIGDFSIFSPRKYLPIFDGGILRLNRPAPGFQIRFQAEGPLFTLRVAKNLFERRKPPASLAVISALERRPEAGSKPGPVVDPESPENNPLHVFPSSTSFLPWMANFPMSRLSKHLLPHFPLLDIGSKRRANYRYLIERVSGLKEIQPLFEQLVPDAVPWVLPLTIGKRPDAHTALRTLGIPAVTWGDVRDPRISAREFPEADFLYKRLVFLPIHQDLERAHLDLIADAVATVCRAGQDSRLR
jgi:perosamine synthetase